MTMPVVLVVDDDPMILNLVEANLRASEYEVLLAEDGESALQVMKEKMPDLVLLDIMLPGIDGAEVCRQIRGRSQVPIIMLTAKNAVPDKVALLTLGADDYVSKPFGVDELLARVRAVLRRKPDAQGLGISSFVSDDLEINFAERRVSVGDRDVHLTPTEFALLKELVLNAGEVLTYGKLLTRIWGSEKLCKREHLRVFISCLRRKIEADHENPKHILTKPGVGYYLRSATQKL